MDKMPNRHKGKNKKATPNAKPKPAKKRKCDGPSCSMFLADWSRRLALKKRQEEEAPKNIVQTIVESLTNALPIIFTKKPPPKSASPLMIETLQTFAPELLPNDKINIPLTIVKNNEIEDEVMSIDEMDIQIESPTNKKGAFKMPKMPVISSDVLKMPNKKEPMIDTSVNTATEIDAASEITRHVNTLRKISLIAEEFNQKTAKNLIEIVDSVQEDLIKKLAEIEAEQKVAANKSNEKLNVSKQGVSIILEEID